MPRQVVGSGRGTTAVRSSAQGLTVKGQPITSSQVTVANTLLGVGQQLGAPTVAMVAIIYAGMGETSLGDNSLTYQNNGAGHTGVLQGPVGDWPNPYDTQGQARSFYNGGKGFQAGGAIFLAKGGNTNPAQIAVEVEVPSIWPTDAYAPEFPGGQAAGVKEAENIVSQLAGVPINIPGTGTPGNVTNAASTWTVGDPSNPDQDYWTTINQYAMDAQIYAFSDGETLYFADGIELMAQRPAAIINRLDKSVVSLRATWDNCLMLDTPIPTPDGWTTMGELKPGDTVFGADGKPTRVVGASDVFTDRDCYRMCFNDGTSIVADAGHFWETVALRKSGATAPAISHQRYQGIRTTKQIADTVRVPGGRKQPGGALNHRIRVAEPLELPDRDLPLDPYLLGCWLGDGDTNAPLITVSHEDATHLVNEVERAGYKCNAREATSTGFTTGHHWRVSILGTTPKLRDLGVLGNKHIPGVYLRASAEQRRALLQGLMDTDGSVTRHCCFCVADERLARSVLELARSLGFRPNWTEKPARGRSRRQFAVHFASRPHLNPFRLPRKRDRYAARLAEKTNNGSAGWRTITAVERTATVPVKCIEVAAEDHLFLAGEAMVPTRNTTFQYTHTHVKKARIQRRTSLARITSPTMVSVRIICDVDKFRAGDTVILAMCGPADGTWLIGDCVRTIYDPFSDLTLVQAMQPISAASGLPGSKQPAGAGGGSPTPGFANPFPGGWVPNRLDMGYDGTFSGSIVAPFSGTITFAAAKFSNWGGYIQLKAANGINGIASDTLYFAEGVAPAPGIAAGTTVQVGDTIGVPAPSPFGNPYRTTPGGNGQIEWGVAASGTVGTPTNPLAETGIPDPRGMVLTFAQWAESTLGVAPPAQTGHAGSA